MRIGSVPSASFGQYKVNKAARTEIGKPALGSDQLEISEASRLFSQALQAAQNTPETRMDRVNELRDQVNSGTYQRSSEAIAAKLLSAVTEL